MSQNLQTCHFQTSKYIIVILFAITIFSINKMYYLCKSNTKYYSLWKQKNKF